MAPPDLGIGLLEMEKGLKLPITGEGVLADSLAKFVSTSQEALTANFAHLSMARSIRPDADQKLTEGLDRLAQLIRQQHQLLGVFGERVLKSGKNEL